MLSGVEQQAGKLLYLIKLKNARKVEEVDGETMARKFPQRTVSFLETKLEWFMPHNTSENDRLPDVCASNGPHSGKPSKIHCECYFTTFFLLLPIFHLIFCMPDVTNVTNDIMYWCQFDDGVFKFIGSAEAKQNFAAVVIKFLQERLEWDEQVNN